MPEFQMRSNEERVVEVKRRIEQKKRKDKHPKCTNTTGSKRIMAKICSGWINF